MNRAAAAAAAGTGDGPAWQEAALDPQTRADPWELEGACCVLRDIFHQLFPALKSTNPLLAGVIGLQQLDQIMPAVGEDFVDPSTPAVRSVPSPIPDLVIILAVCLWILFWVCLEVLFYHVVLAAHQVLLRLPVRCPGLVWSSITHSFQN